MAGQSGDWESQFDSSTIVYGSTILVEVLWSNNPLDSMDGIRPQAVWFVSSGTCISLEVVWIITKSTGNLLWSYSKGRY